MYKLAVSIALLMVFACGYSNRRGSAGLAATCLSRVESFITACSPPIHERGQRPISSDSQSPSEEFEEDDDDSDRGILIASSLSMAIDNVVVISRSTYYPLIQLDITTPPPRAEA